MNRNDICKSKRLQAKILTQKIKWAKMIKIEVKPDIIRINMLLKKTISVVDSIYNLNLSDDGHKYGHNE